MPEAATDSVSRQRDQRQRHPPQCDLSERRYADLQCTKCNATWVGPIGETCSWCIDSVDRMQRWQAEKVLIAPENPTEGALRAWAQRLKVAVQAELVTADQARRAWQKAVSDAA
ncbi:MAG: hypothetical protein O3B42_06560 [Actinomycetota bacterium]|nr:hypothetical protein [Actinomycetota bacterium]